MWIETVEDESDKAQDNVENLCINNVNIHHTININLSNKKCKPQVLHRFNKNDKICSKMNKSRSFPPQLVHTHG